MTTAPTPSEKVQRLAITLEIVGAVPDMNYVTVPRHVARDASVELRRLQAENERLRSAERTLQRLGYQDRGGQEWAPPIGKAPDFDLIDSLRSRIAELERQLVAEARATAGHKLRADQLAQQHRMQAQMHAQATQQLAELEARKPLPLSIGRLEQIWESQRSFHGGEPLKCGHVEFARLVEVEYGVLGRIPIREGNGGQIDHSLITGGSS